MAQFVGGETNYSSWNIFANALEIYRSDGISGFFYGLIPRMLFEVSTIASKPKNIRSSTRRKLFSCFSLR